MCTVPPPPPLPLARERASPGRGSPGRTARLEAVPDGVCEWARDEPELRLACARLQLCTQTAPHRVRYSRAPGVLQRGPTCGLAALAMLARLQLSPDAALAAAQARGYSRRGEMFSCRDMAALAAELLPAAGLPHARVALETEPLYSEETVDRLLAGAMMLVPYNASLQHTPCPSSGHRAHWALVCGVLEVAAPRPYRLHPTNVYAVCRQGKDPGLMLCSLRDLHKSNTNLTDFVQRTDENGPRYVLPEGGVTGPNGLSGQYVVIERL